MLRYASHWFAHVTDKVEEQRSQGPQPGQTADESRLLRERRRVARQETDREVQDFIIVHCCVRKVTPRPEVPETHSNEEKHPRTRAQVSTAVDKQAEQRPCLESSEREKEIAVFLCEPEVAWPGHKG